MKLIDRATHVGLMQVTEADYIVVSKQRRLMYLLNKGQIVRVYSVAFGSGVLKGPKIQSGDGRTPEGLYFIDGKNSKSKYHLGLHLSYPSQNDTDFAVKNSIADPGSDIMIHGFPTDFIDNLNPEVVRQVHPKADWTQGCIAVTDTEIEEVFAMVKAKVPVEICPLNK
ncbi:MAG: L,D-transpeptidase family protein [Bdellovibrio sp.]|nr:L,D-transpeptidase family protein [Bdellovibrio sp.]